MNKTLKAKHEFFYGGKTLKAGEEFLAADPDAGILVALDRASDVTSSSRKATPKLEPAPKLETKVEMAAEAAESQKRRRYMRRDMQAGE